MGRDSVRLYIVRDADTIVRAVIIRSHGIFMPVGK